MTTINWQPNFLKNEVVKLSPLLESDFEMLFKLASDPNIWEQHPQKDRYKKEVFQAFFDSAIESQTAFLIWTKNRDQLIGTTRFYDFNSENRSIVIGFTFLAREFWGGVYNKAVKKLLLDYAFLFVGKVYFYVGATNFRSQKAVGKLGATLVEDTNLFNTPHIVFVLLKEVWEGID